MHIAATWPFLASTALTFATADNSINDPLGRFTAKGFTAGMAFEVYGSAVGGNNTLWTILTVTDGKIVTTEPLGGNDSGANLKTLYGPCTLTWHRRTRVGGNWITNKWVALGEAFDRYEIVLLDSTFATELLVQAVAGVDTNTVNNPMLPTVTLTAEQIGVAYLFAPPTALYVRIYQISDLVGRGYPGEVTVTA